MGSKFNPYEGLIEAKIEESIENGAEYTEEQIEKIFQKSLEFGGEGLLKILKKNSSSMLKEHAAVRRGFEKRLYALWSTPLKKYETCLVIAQEMGDIFNKNHRPQAAENNNFVFEVLTRLHARVCQLGSEILHLLRGGYSSGAMTRWRAMHEVVVVMAFISEHGNEMAERYMLHHHIEGAKAAREYIEIHGKQGEITPEMLAENEEIRDRLIAKYGREYGRDYGWAASVLPKDIRFSISALEQKVDLQRVRPIYRLASHPTHANPKSMFFNLEQGQKLDVLLTGPSNSGLADPGANALQHLVLATSILVTLFPDETTTMGSIALLRLSEEAVAAFMKVHNKVVQMTLELSSN